MEKLFAIKTRMFYRLPTNGAEFSSASKTLIKKKKVEEKGGRARGISTGYPVRGPQVLVSSQWIDDKPLRAEESPLEQTLPWSFQPSEGHTAEGNLGQNPGSLCSRPGSGPDSLGHCLLMMSLFSASVPHLYNRKK